MMRTRRSTALAVAGPVSVVLWLTAGAGEALATHVQCGDVLTASTTLDSDLVDCPSDGVVIGADNVKLDLAGHMIDGAGNGQGVDNGGGFDHLWVEDGSVRDFGVGVQATEAAHNHARALTVTANDSSGIAFDTTSHSTVEDSVSSGNGEYGVRYFFGSLHNKIDRVTASDNRVGGIRIFLDCEDNEITGSEADRNGIQGFQIDRCTKTRIARNAAAANISVGIELQYAPGNEVLDNRLDRNGGGIAILGTGGSVARGNSITASRYGIALGQTEDNLVAQNEVRDSAEIGVTISASNAGPSLRNVVTENAITGSGRSGIEVFESDDNVLSANVITSNRQGISFRTNIFEDGSERNRVEGNTVSRNETSGIAVGSRHDDTTVEGNVVEDNGGTGISVGEAEAPRVDHNTVSRNGGSGIVVDGLGGSADRPGDSVDGNSVSANASTGLLLFNITDGSVSGNTSIANNGTAVLCFGCDRDVIARNVVADSPSGGISLNGSDGNLVEGNAAERIGGTAGIELSNSNDNVVRHSSAVGNAADGILVRGTAERTLLDRNTTDRNGDDGIDVDSRGATATKNKADDNVDLGIEAVPGTIDGGGNKASGNGNPRQCLNVSCK